MMNIILTSSSLSRSELEAGLSLTRAFFPEAKVLTEALVGEMCGEPTQRLQETKMISDTKAKKSDVSDDKGLYEDITWAVINVEVDSSCAPSKGKEIGEIHEIQGIEEIREIRASYRITSKEDKAISITLNPDRVQTILLNNKLGKETETKLLLKHSLFTLLSKVTGHTPPWGILTGIRPSKILHRLNDLEIPKVVKEEILRERYAIREDKIRLLENIVEIQRPFLKTIKDHPERVAVYVGIPFCPTRCTYCSFPAYSLQKGREPLEAYLKGLYEEIQVTGEWMKETGRVADSLYLGGGTPTILTTREISDLLQFLYRSIPLIKNKAKGSSEEELELSVEAGRPDTLSKEKLKALQEMGVNRLSINPQTMHDRTLKRIGRAHTVEDILRVYEYAREISDWVINMDLILGLPGEHVVEVTESLSRIGELEPDNLTVHALAIKKGSKEYELGLKQNLSRELEAMQKRVMTSAFEFGLHPYYMYRQKHIAGNLENIGFARPGKECRYNIAIMEERQSVIGIGAGASSKVVNTQDYSLVNLQHNSSWQVYLSRWKDDVQERARRFEMIKKSQA